MLLTVLTPTSQRTALWCLCCWLSATAAFAQGDAGAIRGEVRAAADRSLLPGATITLEPVQGGPAIAVTSDRAGAFLLAGVRPGHYVLGAEMEGFVSEGVQIVLQPRETKFVGLPLDVAGVDTRIEVGAARGTVVSTASPTSTVLSADHVHGLNPTAAAQLSEAVVGVAPGMVRGHDDFVHVRGHEVALNPLIQGVSFWENPHAVFSSGVSPSVIETASVLTGGFPAEYGNRFGGVVDIVTKSGLSIRHRGSGTVTAGEAGRYTVLGEYGGRRGRLGYYLHGAVLGSDRYFSPPQAEAIHDTGRARHVFGQLDAALPRAGSVRLLVMGDQSAVEIPTTDRDVALRPQADPRQRTRQQTAIASWMLPISADTLLNTSVYQRQSRLELIPASGPLVAAAALQRKLLTAGAKTDLTRFAGRHALKTGVDAVWLRPEEDLSYRYDGYRVLTHLLGLPHLHLVRDPLVFTGRQWGHQLSAYVQDTVQLGSRLTAGVGVRIDGYDLVVSSVQASPRVNVAYALDRVTLYGSFNRFFVPPPVEGVLSSAAGLTSQIREIGRALAPIEPTIENQVELGASTRIGRLRLSVTGYHRTSDQPVHTTIWPDSRIYSYASFDRGRAYGLDTKGEWTMDRLGLSGYVTYALGRVWFFNPVRGGFVTEAAHVTSTDRFLAPMDQTHTATLGLNYRHRPSGVALGMTGEYGSGTPIGHGDAAHAHAPGDADDHAHAAAGSAARVAPHATANAFVSLDLLADSRGGSRLAFRLDVENVTNRVHTIARDSGFGPGQVSIPRLVSMTMRVRF